MKVGFNLLLWTGQVTEEHFPLLADIKDAGGDGVEIPIFGFDGTPWEALAQELKNQDLASTAVACLPEGANLIGADGKSRENALAFLKQCVDTCHEMGAEVLAGPIYSPVGRLTGAGPTEDECKHCVDGLRALGEHADGSGVTIALEPLNRFETYFLNTVADSVAILDQVNMPNVVGMMYDTFHANIEEKNIYAAIQAGAKYIHHVHISANDRGTPGEDHIDYNETMAALRNIGYNGWLTIEAFGQRLPELAAATCIWRPTAPSEDHLMREGIAFVHKLWRSQADSETMLG